jgi:hypothetical protein
LANVIGETQRDRQPLPKDAGVEVEFRQGHGIRIAPAPVAPLDAPLIADKVTHRLLRDGVGIALLAVGKRVYFGRPKKILWRSVTARLRAPRAPA